MCALAFFVRALGIVQIRCTKSSSSRGRPPTSSRRCPVSAKSSTIPPYGPPIFQAARMTWASSLSSSTRSGATSFAGSGTPSAGDRSRTARPTYQRRNVLIDFKVLLAAPGAPRCSIAETTSTTSRLVTSWMLRPAHGFPTSRRRSLEISATVGMLSLADLAASKRDSRFRVADQTDPPQGACRTGNKFRDQSTPIARRRAWRDRAPWPAH